MLKAILSMSVATTLSRITGYVRTMVQAAVLGSGVVVSNAYTFSNSLPNQVYELFMGGLLSSIFIPILIDRMSQHGEPDARRLTNALLTIIVPVLTVVALVSIVFAAPLVGLATDFRVTETFTAEDARQAEELSVLLFRVFALQILFYGLGAVAMGVLNAHRRFFLPTFAPVLNNLIVITSFIGYALLDSSSPSAAIYVLAGGTTLGVAVMSLVLLPAMWSLGYRPRIVAGHPALASAARLAGPMLVFIAASVGVQFTANYFGSAFSGVDQLWYAFTIFSLPYGIFIVSIATALVPDLSEKYANRDTDGYRDTLSFGLRTMAFIAVPASVGMVTLAEPIVGLLYQRGEFGPDDTQAVAAILVAYGVGLLGYGAYFVLVRSFYARQNTKTPAALNVGLLLLYILLAYTLSAPLGMGLPGVALAFSAAYGALALGLLITMRRETRTLDGRRMAVSLAKILVAGAVMYVVASIGVSLVGTGTNILNRVVVLALIGGVAVTVYLGVSLLLKTEELKSAISLLNSRFGRVN
jgi:putative peptidoglycan lipid II flippase